MPQELRKLVVRLLLLFMEILLVQLVLMGIPLVMLLLQLLMEMMGVWNCRYCKIMAVWE